MVPSSSQPLVSLGLFPEPSPDGMADAVARIRQYEARGAAAGGKRYLVGFCHGWTADDWAAHYGPTWNWFRTMKRQHDPNGLLNPGFFAWT
jgi:FAD/FMN-containing dehydrogenase